MILDGMILLREVSCKKDDPPGKGGSCKCGATGLLTIFKLDYGDRPEI
jgi:hypothetical protein